MISGLNIVGAVHGDADDVLDDCIHLDKAQHDALLLLQIEKEIIENAFANGWVKPEPPKTRTGKKVAVIGDGNAAFDLARTLVRIGADVTLLSWFGADKIPADPEEYAEAMAVAIAEARPDLAPAWAQPF
jgi:hypothetical protein